MNRCPIYAIPANECGHCARAAAHAGLQTRIDEARRHTAAAIEALMRDGDRAQATRHLTVVGFITTRLPPTAQGFAGEAAEHVAQAIGALNLGDQVEAMHQLAQIEIVLDRMAVEP